MNVLVLTDHAAHSASNSLYVLARSLAGAAEVGEVRVASRGTVANAPFFACVSTDPLLTIGVDARFTYEGAKRAFAQLDDGSPATPLDWPDAVLLRVPHPVPPTWFDFLPRAFPGVPLVNRPAGVAATTSTTWLLTVPELCAPMALCQTAAEVQAFAKTRDTVLKPLDGYGGVGILRIRDGRVEVQPGDNPHQNARRSSVALAEWPLHPLADRPYLAMQYLSRVGEGDKRIVVVGGEVLGAVLRVPPPGGWLCNVAQGGRAEPAGVSLAERRILDVLAPRMAELGVVMYGVDTLVGDDGERVLSEVNTMSIGGLNDLPAVDGRSAPERAARALLEAFRSESTLTPIPTS